MARPGISKRELLEYVCCEEDEDVSERLKQSSLIFVGSVMEGRKKVHYWSYPSLGDIAWVAMSDDGALSTVESDNVPSEIKARAVPSGDHPIRLALASHSTVDRSPISTPQWVPASRAPRLLFFPMHEISYPFERAAKLFLAKSKRQDLGLRFWHLFFCVKLTSGRFAIIQSEEAKPNCVSIELEVEPNRGEYPHGFVHVSDLREILSVIGTELVYPLQNCQYHWRE